MTQRMHYFCDCKHDDCEAQESKQQPINWHENPVVLYLVVGEANGGGDVDLTKLPPFVSRLLQQPTQRIEMHAACAPRVLAGLLAEKAPEAEPETPAGAPIELGEPGSAEG